MTKILAANIFTITGAGIFLIFGIAYLYKSLSVKNHCSVTQKSLDELNVNNRTFLFALMRGVAGGSLALAFSIIYLQVQYARQALSWIPLLILISSSIFFLISINAMVMVRRKTTIRPPVIVLLLAIVCIVAGYFLNITL